MDKGESVGREWDYRSYISGSLPRHSAVWYFRRIPGYFGERSAVPVEFTFDIFRTTKEPVTTEGKGVACQFTFAKGWLTPQEVEIEYEKLKNERNALQRNIREKANRDKKERPAESEAIDTRARQELDKITEQMLEKYGLYVVHDWNVVDYHTQTLELPGSLFKSILADPGRTSTARDGSPVPMLQVLVNIEPRSRNQLLGVAKHDLYILETEQPFWLNFVKGALGLWLTSCLVLGLAVSLSTYLSGVITLLTTLFLCLAGLFIDHIKKLAMGISEGGGPLESIHRLVTRQGVAVKLEESPGVSFLLGFDEAWRWWLRFVMNVIPDITRFDLTRFVANGFNIAFLDVFVVDQLLPILAYLIPWAILAYYLMESREIANPM
jgi:hypothetical protein